jgi:hypothetical protein
MYRRATGRETPGASQRPNKHSIAGRVLLVLSQYTACRLWRYCDNIALFSFLPPFHVCSNLVLVILPPCRVLWCMIPDVWLCYQKRKLKKKWQSRISLSMFQVSESGSGSSRTLCSPNGNSSEFFQHGLQSHDQTAGRGFVGRKWICGQVGCGRVPDRVHLLNLTVVD